MPIAFFLISLSSARLRAQAPKPEPDTVVFANGEKLVGHFETFAGGMAKFKSDAIGEVSIDLSKVQELHVSEKFAVVRKNVKLARHERDGQIPVGTISITNKTVDVNPGDGKPTQSVAVGDISNIVDQPTFDQAFHHESFFADWKGAAALGASIVEATQNSVSISSSVNLVRAVPTQDWLPPRDRTIVDFSDSYGKVTQPGTPEVRTSIYHADAERDEYFTSTMYALAAVAFDHNFSQGLDLQQLYGGGIGWTAIHNDKESLDFKGSVDYEKQSFIVPSQDQNLIDSVFSEYYKLKFAHNILLNEQASYSPAWSNMRAYSAYASVGITFPVYKRLGFNANVIDSFLNNPPVGFKKNSVQFATGITYSLP